jgi:cyclopropane-fatty-acyl-phospholipid synthase
MSEQQSAPTVDEALQATNQHYQLPAALFAQFLDKRLKYSSGLYTRPGMSLEDAQTEKLHFIARQIRAKSVGCLLDVGCGWGSLTLFMAQEYGHRVTGVTPSSEQAAYIRETADAMGISDRVTVVVGPFSEVPLEGRFDAVTMVGSINHMPNQDEVMSKASRHMREGAALYLSESCFRSAAKYNEFANRPATRQVTEDIFGFAEMHPLSTLVRVIEGAGFSVTDVTDLTWHFKRTINDWVDRAVHNRERIEDIVAGMYQPLRTYLDTTNTAWGFTTKQYAVVAVRSRLGVEELW